MNPSIDNSTIENRTPPLPSSSSVIDIIDIGDTVLCDYCNDDYTESDECGGLLINNYAVCPRCITEARIDEAELICPATVTFKGWVLAIRNGDNTITIEMFNIK